MKEIFIVEDDHDIRELIEFLLVSRDYKVRSFASAEAFSQQIQAEQPDLILLDIRLPDGNGVDICTDLKTGEATASIPVVLMSAHLDRESLKDSQADDFIPKPFDIDELTERIKLQLT